MKRLFLLPLGLMLFAACKEQGPVIDFGPKASDTAFTTTVEAPQQRVVVMEEFTGVSCPPCYAAHAVLKSLEDQYPDRIAIMGIQVVGITQANPLERNSSVHPDVYTRNDNRTADGTDLNTQLYGGNLSIPKSGIDRTDMGGSLLALASAWPAAVEARLAVPPPANVKITSSYSSTSHQATIKVHVAYTGTVTKAQLLSVALIEHEVIDAQEGGPGFTQDYHHQHVLRDILTAPVGTTILSGIATKQPGQVYERVFVYNVNEAWNPDNCRVIAFVSNNEGADHEVLQGAEAHLK